jgi:hypothetical protein
MFTQIYKHLKNNGFDVYSIGQHKGVCSSPYIVIKENGESEIAGTSLTNDIVEILVYYPVGKYSELSNYKKRILNVMKYQKGIRRVIEPMPTIIDDDKKAYMTSFTYRKIKMKEGV